MHRTYTVSWKDPSSIQKATRRMSGLEVMEAIHGGQLPPPFAVLPGMEPTVVAPGKVTFRMQPAEYPCNPVGTIHGGIIRTLCDTALGCGEVAS